LLRTTRKLAITDFGHSVLEHAQQVSAEVEAAAALAQQRQVKPSGRLRVSMPADFATIVLGRLLAEFIEKYPAISLELDLTHRRGHRSLRGAVCRERRAGAGARGLDFADGRGVGRVPGTAPDAGTNAGVPRRAADRVLGPGVPACRARSAAAEEGAPRGFGPD